jgi:hypothetical protein
MIFTRIIPNSHHGSQNIRLALLWAEHSLAQSDGFLAPLAGQTRYSTGADRFYVAVLRR